MRHFKHCTRVYAPIERVAEFHRSTAALKILTPPPIFVQLHHVEPLSDNSVADFTLWLGPIPVRWIARHSNVDPLSGFVDTQVKGPFHSWEHRHKFVAIDDHITDVIDQIQAEPNTWLSWIMWLNLRFLFLYRGWQIRRICERD